MKVSILISSYNGAQDLPRCLDSMQLLPRAGIDLEVIVRDDCSGDRTSELVEQRYPWVRLIRGTETLGFVGSCNLLWKQAAGDIVCCLNQDTVLEPGFLLGGVAVLENLPDAAAVNTNMIMPWVMSLETFLVTPPERMPKHEYQLAPGGYARYAAVPAEVRETDFVSGGAFFLRRSALRPGESLFDPAICMYCEDLELSLRLRARGARLYYAPTAIVFHNQQAKRLGTRSALRKLFSVTATRFSVLSRNRTPLTFLQEYPRYLLGIVEKMQHLGLARARQLVAGLVGWSVAALFLALAPYWWLRSCMAAARSKYPDVPR